MYRFGSVGQVPRQIFSLKLSRVCVDLTLLKILQNDYLLASVKIDR